MILYPNAKINIGLNILKRRNDGYHDISSVFYPIYNLYDILEVIPSSKFSFTCSGIFTSKTNNICLKAYEILNQDFDVGNVSIHLDKKIPIGAGLGGGSSDATFLLKALNILFNLKMSKNQLNEYAKKIGADCPFFIDNTPKYVTGVGDIMKSLDLNLFDYDIKFTFPEISVSTAEAYKNVIPKDSEHKLMQYIREPINKWKGNIKNDFEESVFKNYPSLKELKKEIYSKGAIYASMTGSGSVLYGVFKK